MTPSLYDLLDVAPDATEAEIKAAWKSAIAELDPTDRRFRVYNQAAEVLLDPAKRVEYDAELAVRAEQQQVEDQAADEDPTATAAPAAEGAVGRPAGPAGVAATSGRSIPGWVIAGVAVLTALAVAASAWMWSKPSDASIDESTRAAQSAAERAIVPILSYDAATLDEDQQAAQTYMTDSYREEYDKVYAVIKENAPNTKTVVTTEVLASGVVRSGDQRVEVLLFVDQPTTNKQVTEPVVYKNQVRVQMEKVGDEWLVDCLLTTPNGVCG